MKNLTLVIGTLLIALNTLVGLIVTDYAMFNFLLADLSIVLSVGLIYFLACSKKTANGFKIGLTLLLLFTGIARFVCVAVVKQVWENNYCFIVAIGILLLELLFVATAFYASGKRIEIK
jgi:hypothetical protein